MGGPLGGPFLYLSLSSYESQNDQIPSTQGTHYWGGPGLPWEVHQWLGWDFCLLLYTLGALGPVFGVQGKKCQIR